MNEEELDLWYDQQKEDAAAKYKANIEARMDVKQRKESFLKDMALIHKQYQEKYDLVVKNKDKSKRKQENKKRVLAPIKAVWKGLGWAKNGVFGGIKAVRKKASIYWRYNLKLRLGKRWNRFSMRKASKLKPYRLWYTRHIWPHQNAVEKPIRRVLARIKQGLIDGIKGAIKGIKKAVVKSVEFLKKILAKVQAIAKKIGGILGKIMKVVGKIFGIIFFPLKFLLGKFKKSED